MASSPEKELLNESSAQDEPELGEEVQELNNEELLADEARALEKYDAEKKTAAKALPEGGTSSTKIPEGTALEDGMRVRDDDRSPSAPVKQIDEEFEGRTVAMLIRLFEKLSMPRKIMNRLDAQVSALEEGLACGPVMEPGTEELEDTETDDLEDYVEEEDSP